jgi:16S rRNA (guanine527-N7)-methyltransferase
MDEDLARQWLINELRVSRETLAKIERFVVLLREANGQQNLVSSASLEAVFSRHIVDSAQLYRLGATNGSWLDLGSGAGLPGLIIAILGASTVTLVESRRLRCDWLRHAVNELSLDNVRIEARRLEAVPPFTAEVITARAFAPLPRLFQLAHRFSTEGTRWILPKGRSATEELASVNATWHGQYTMHPSVTDLDSAIIIARNVQPKGVR